MGSDETAHTNGLLHTCINACCRGTWNLLPCIEVMYTCTMYSILPLSLKRKEYRLFIQFPFPALRRWPLKWKKRFIQYSQYSLFATIRLPL
jgi:hypothetical protein